MNKKIVRRNPKLALQHTLKSDEIKIGKTDIFQHKMETSENGKNAPEVFI